MDELFLEYGKLMVNKEIVDGQVNNVKMRIAEAMNKQEQPVAEKVTKEDTNE